MPRKITTIGSKAFLDCFVVDRISLPDVVTSLGVDLFKNCNGLDAANIPEGVTALPENIFNGAYSIVNIVVPSTVTSIGAAAFYSCRSIEEIHFKPASPPAIANSNAFTNVPTDCKIYVPAGKLSAYTSASNYPSSATYTYVEE